MNLPIEYTFTQDFIKRIRDKKQFHTDAVLNSTLEQMDYAERRGYIQALSEAESIILELQKHYFPEYR